MLNIKQGEVEGSGALELRQVKAGVCQVFLGEHALFLSYRHRAKLGGEVSLLAVLWTGLRAGGGVLQVKYRDVPRFALRLIKFDIAYLVIRIIEDL